MTTKTTATLEPGARIYYTGNMANDPGYGTITGILRNHYQITMDDGDQRTGGETYAIPCSMVRDDNQGHANEFWTADAWAAHRDTQIQRMRRDRFEADRRAWKSQQLTRCADCGERGETTGHMTCQYPSNR